MNLHYIPYLKPTMAVVHIQDITPEMLDERGISVLVFDVDDTLVPHLGDVIDDTTVKHIHKLQKGPIKKIFIASNSRRDLSAIAKQLGAEIITSTRLSRKPLAHHYRKILKEIDQQPHTIAMVGDKLLTDMLGGNIAGMQTILAAPFKRIKQNVETTIPGIGQKTLAEETSGLIKDARTWLRGFFNKSTHSLQRSLWFLLAVAGIIVFGSILEGVQEQDVIVAFDQSVSQFMVDNRTPFFNDLFTTITALAGTFAITLLVALWFFLLVGKRHRKAAFILVAGAIIQALLVVIIKVIVERDRPDLSVSLVRETSFSFPSGHTMAATAVWGIAAYMIAKSFASRWRRVLVGIIFFVAITAIALSRVYLGVHYLSDTLASVGLGIAIVALYLTWTTGKDTRLPKALFDPLLRWRLITGFMVVILAVLLWPTFFL